MLRRSGLFRKKRGENTNEINKDLKRSRKQQIDNIVNFLILFYFLAQPKFQKSQSST